MNSKTIYQIIYSILADEATGEEHRAFSEWLKADEANRVEFDKLKRLYQVTSYRTEEKTFDTELAWQQVRRQTLDKKKTFKLPTWTRYAAMIAIVVSVGLLFLPKNTQTTPFGEANMEKFDQPTLLLDNGEKIALNEESFAMNENDVVIKNDARNQLVYESSKESKSINTTEKNHLVIPKGKTYQLLLSDGTQIWLNSETELIYPTQFSGKKREVTLVGEAFFKVANNKGKPFIVNANGMAVTVLGTSFNVSCYTADNTLSTTLIEGSVSVTTNNGKPHTITPSEQFTYNKRNTQSAVRTVNAELYTSWMNGKYIFKDATLDEIITKLQRWYNFSVTYADESLKNNRYSVIVEKDTNLDQLLEIISYTSNVKLERINNSINIKKIKRGE